MNPNSISSDTGVLELKYSEENKLILHYFPKKYCNLFPVTYCKAKQLEKNKKKIKKKKRKEI